MESGQGVLKQVEGGRASSGPQGAQVPAWAPSRAVGWRRHPAAGNLSALSPSWPLFWGKEELCWGVGVSGRPKGPAVLRPWGSLPGSHLGPREILAALANRIILSV